MKKKRKGNKKSKKRISLSFVEYPNNTLTQHGYNLLSKRCKKKSWPEEEEGWLILI